MQLWAGITFTALGGQTADFLQRAANQNFKLRNIRPQFGGISAQCAARRYFALHKLAKPCHVRLHVTARRGVYFRLRGLFARNGMWCALAVFFVFFTYNQNLIWQIDDSDLTAGQQARVAEILWESCGITAGAYASEALLASAETAILTQTDEFSWVSLNFSGGRLTIEATTAVAVPDIAVGADGNVVASAAGQIVSVNVQQGTPMVSVGDTVSRGQVLIAAARLEHDEETLVFEPTAGEILAQFTTSYTANIAMVQQVLLAAEPVEVKTKYALFVFGREISVPDVAALLPFNSATDAASTTENTETTQQSTAQTTQQTTRRVQVSWLGFSFPITILEENAIYYQQAELTYTKEEALALAALACSEQLYADYPDATIADYYEVITAGDDLLTYQVQYQVIADICSLHE